MPAGHIKGTWLTLGANAIKRTNKAAHAIKRTNKATNAIKRTNKAMNAIKRTNKRVDGFEWQTRVSQTMKCKAIISSFT